MSNHSDHYWEGKLKKKNSKAKLLLYPKKKYTVNSQKNKEALARLKAMLDTEEPISGVDIEDGN